MGFETMIRREKFGPFEKFVLTGSGALEAEILPYGATLCALRFQGVDVVLGYQNAEAYQSNREFMGTVVGRYANRIADGQISLNGKNYLLTQNEKGNHLHGGFIGTDHKLWEARILEENKLRLTVLLEDGEEGYPGEMTLSVDYEVLGDALRIIYTATTDRDTVLNPTNHTYFNLNGQDGPSTVNHELTIKASAYTPVSKKLIPTGELRSVEGTLFDFRGGKPIDRDLNGPELASSQGYDHNFVLDGTGFRHVATARSPITGIGMDCYTDRPGMQFCGGNYLSGTEGKSGPMGQYQGFCLETQNFPDAPNHPEFPSAVLRAGEVFTSVTEYRFYK